MSSRVSLPPGSPSSIATFALGSSIIVSKDATTSEQATTFFSHLRANEVEKAIEIFKKLPEQLQIYCIKLSDAKKMSLLHKLTIRNLNDKVLEILKLLPFKTQEACLTLEDNHGWTILDYANQNKNESLKRNIQLLIEQSRSTVMGK